jgi:hypothetical protein
MARYILNNKLLPIAAGIYATVKSNYLDVFRFNSCVNRSTTKTALTLFAFCTLMEINLKHKKILEPTLKSTENRKW